MQTLTPHEPRTLLASLSEHIETYRALLRRRLARVATPALAARLGGVR